MAIAEIGDKLTYNPGSYTLTIPVAGVYKFDVYGAQGGGDGHGGGGGYARAYALLEAGNTVSIGVGSTGSLNGGWDGTVGSINTYSGGGTSSVVVGSLKLYGYGGGGASCDIAWSQDDGVYQIWHNGSAGGGAVSGFAKFEYNGTVYESATSSGAKGGNGVVYVTLMDLASMNLFCNGVEVKTITYNGVEVKKWIHNGAELGTGNVSSGIGDTLVTYIYSEGCTAQRRYNSGETVTGYTPSSLIGKGFVGWTTDKNSTTAETIIAAGSPITLYGIVQVSGSASQTVSVSTIDRYDSENNHTGSDNHVSFTAPSRVPLNVTVTLSVSFYTTSGANNWYSGNASVGVGGVSVGVDFNSIYQTKTASNTGKLANRSGGIGASSPRGSFTVQASITYSWNGYAVG